jgi:gas vesicle protein
VLCWIEYQIADGERHGTLQEAIDMKNSAGEKFLWLLSGIGLGTCFALLFAPKTGREMRRYLARVAEDSRNRAAESGQEVLEKGKLVIERGKAVVDEALDFVDRGRRILSR